MQKWLWSKGWRSLRDIQEAAIPKILDGGSDVLISAPTAGGKTEAAFLPIVSALADSPPAGVGCLCLSPLRALINDQARRLESLCDAAGLRLQPWHGDVSAGRAQFWRRPAEILLITPESLEAMFIRKPGALAGVLASLRFIVVDELHALVGSVRGRQMQSLLHRVDTLIGRRVARIALSATFGDTRTAETFLRHDGAMPCATIAGTSGGTELRVQLRAWIRRKDGPDPYDGIAESMFGVLRGHSHLMFANTRGLVEQLSDSLRESSERARLPNEFFPHHGSLSRDHRLWLEERLRDGNLPTTAVCTSTLELGVDLGDVESVVQIGAPPSVAALKQRLGRSGRRPGKPQILRQHVVLADIGRDCAPADRLRLDLLQGIASIELMLRACFESPHATGDPHYSTLLQQVLSVIAQRRGATAQQLHVLLCGTGPFREVDPAAFARFLRSLGRTEVIEQLADGTLVPGAVGEQLLSGYDIYIAFAVPEEFRLLHNGRLLGTLPLENPAAPGMLMVFGGRRWRVEHVDVESRTLVLVPAPSGVVPAFGGGGPAVSGLVRREMQAQLMSQKVPVYLDAQAQDQLAAARVEFRRMGLDAAPLYTEAASVWFAPWCADSALHALQLALRAGGVEAMQEDAFLAVSADDAESATAQLHRLARDGLPAAGQLLAFATPVPEQKFDRFLDPELLLEGYGARHLATDEAEAALRCMFPG